MFKRKKNVRIKAQIMVEYILIIGIVIVMLLTMLPIVTRVSQSMVKVVADQVGVQENADQAFDSSGHLVSDYSSTRFNTDKTLEDNAGVTTYRYDDITLKDSESFMNLGFIERPKGR